MPGAEEPISISGGYLPGVTALAGAVPFPRYCAAENSGVQPQLSVFCVSKATPALTASVMTSFG